MIAFIISSVIAFILLVWLIIDVITNSKLWGYILFLILMTGVVGFGMSCDLSTDRTELVRVQKFSYAKTSSRVILETPDITETYFDAQTYNGISDSSKVYYEIGYDIYGGVNYKKIMIEF